jgi:hypothetical protein
MKDNHREINIQKSRDIYKTNKRKRKQNNLQHIESQSVCVYTDIQTDS